MLQPAISICLEIKSDFHKIINKDNGSGIDENCKKVFHLFETMDNEHSQVIWLLTDNYLLEILGESIVIKKKKKNKGSNFI